MAVFDVVFSSGGTKAVAFAGAIEVLTRRGAHSVRRLAGTSAGAIACTLLASGYTAAECIKAFGGVDGKSPFADFLEPPKADDVLEAVRGPDSETRELLRGAVVRAVDKFLDGVSEKVPRVGIGLKLAVGVGRPELYDKAFDAFFAGEKAASTRLSHLLGFLEFGGFFDVKPVTDWITAMITAKVNGFRPDWSMERFHAATGRDMTVVVADTTDKRALYLNHRTAPDCPLVDAVRMSMSIPMVWPEVPWRAEWGKYLGDAITGHFCVDGGAVLNMPIALFATPNDPAVKRVMGDPPVPAGNPLGLWLDDTLAVPGDIEAPVIRRSKVGDRLTRLVETATRWEDEIIRRFEAFVCRVPSNGYSATEFTASPARMRVLTDAGRDAMATHLKNRPLVP